MFLKTSKWLAQRLLKNSGQGRAEQRQPRAETAQNCGETRALSTSEQYSAPSQPTAVISHLLWLSPGRDHLEDSLLVSCLLSWMRKHAGWGLERELRLAQEWHPSSLALVNAESIHQGKSHTVPHAVQYSVCCEADATVNYRDKSRFHAS